MDDKRNINICVDDDFDRFGIPFATRNNKYYFDSGTGKVLRCTEDMYKLLLNIFKNKGKVVDVGLSRNKISDLILKLNKMVAEENIFKARKLDFFNCAHINNLKELVDQGCRQLILEVTENCNLRCKYCIYGEETENFRGFGARQMNFDIAKSAIDYFAEKSDKKQDLMMSFYGGEPLLNYKLIVMATEYAKKKLGSRVTFNLTSNLTLMNKKMAKFFADNSFRITCSLDGNEEIHNQNRVFKNEIGSYEKTVGGLKLLYESYDKDKRKYIGTNSVISPPYNNEKFDSMDNFFNKLSFIDSDSPRSVSYEGRDIIANDSDLLPNVDLISANANTKFDLTSWEYEKIYEEHETVFSDMLDEGLKEIHNRRISDIPFVDSGLNACCIPGIQRLYVSTKGNFFACERIGNSPAIGNVRNGISFDRIKRYYVDDYSQMSKENCKKCWAIQLCNVCYARCFGSDGLDMKRKKILCEGCRTQMYKLLILYHTILEEQPDLLLKYNEDENYYERRKQDETN